MKPAGPGFDSRRGDHLVLPYFKRHGGDLSMSAVESRLLRKVYHDGGKRVEALRGVSFEVRRGTITTILGPNGAGKTTLVRILATQLLPTDGKAFVLGYDVVEEASEVRRRIAVLPQEAQPLLFPSPLEFVKYMLAMRGASFGEAEGRARRALEEMGIPRKYWDRSTWALSGGYRRRVLLSYLIATDAEVVFMDEPSIGLDPIARRNLWSRILAFKGKGITILLTTHYMEEAYILSDELLLLHKGRLVGSGRPQELVNSLPVRYKVVVTNACELDVRRLDPDASVGTRPPITLYYRSMQTALEVSRSLASRGCETKLEPVTLEDYFILKVGGELA